MSNQSGVQQDIRDSTGTAGTWSEDWSALFDADAVAAGTWDERLLAWINGKLSSSYTNVNAAKQAYAVDQGFANWSSMDSVTLVLSGAATLASGETNVFSLDFTDSFWQASTGIYGSAYVRDATTPANNYNSHPYGLLSYTAPSAKMLRQSDGILRFGAHNLYLNSAAPANQSITVMAGATYAITITGSVSVTASGAASGTWTAGTTTFTAATGTLTLGSTSGAGTVHLRRTPSVNTYLATGAAPAYALPYEWDLAGNPIGIRAEEARTNLHTYSQNGAQFGLLTAAGMQPLGSGSVANAISAPDGTMTGTFVAEFTNSRAHYMYSSGTPADTNTQTGSWFVKAGTRSKVRIQIGHGSATHGVYADFDLSAGTIITNATAVGTGYTALAGSAFIETYANGWYRIGVTASVAPATGHVVYVVLLDGAGSNSYAGDGVSGLYVWGAQLELGAFATSYIPTSGATVPRAMDTIELASSKFSSDGTQGTLFAEVATAPDTTTRVVARLQTAGEGYVLLRSTTNWRGYLWSGGNYIFGDINVASGGSKGAFAWSQDNAALYANGAQLGTDLTGTPVALTSKLQIGGDGTTFFNRHVRSLMFIPTRLTNAKLAELTT